MPAFNEQLTIESVVRRALDHPLVGEVLVVDDASTDKTPDVLAEIDHPRLTVLRHPFNMGKGAGLRHAFAEVTMPYVVVQDADLEYDPSDYDTLLEPLLDGRADVVYGSRFAGGSSRRVLMYWHSLGNKVLTLASNAATNLNLTDVETCYKAFRREVLESIHLVEDRFGFEPEITAKVARQRWRIYEVAISYNGRTYDEGKKSGWRDGIRALYCIVRYSPIVDARVDRAAAGLTPTVDEELAATLHNLDDAHNYADWIVDHFRPFLGGTVVELGAGTGTMTTRLIDSAERVVASDLSGARVADLNARFGGHPAVEVMQGDAEAVLHAVGADAVVMINVLEHIEDDVGELRRIHAGLEPGGVVAIFVPAHDALYSEFDAKVGHFRRYSAASLATALSRAGFDVEETRYVNQPGALAWWVLARMLGRTPTSSTLVKTHDRYILPVLRRLEKNRRPRFGQSLVAVGRKAPIG